VLKSNDYEYKLKMANTYYEKKDYRQAQVLFEELFPVFKGTPQFDDLYYKYAYSHYNAKRLYALLKICIKGYLEVFPSSTKGRRGRIHAGILLL
jgi:outer membrane protein assembly factor BamD